MTFREKVQALQQSSGKTWRECCQVLGGRGGNTTARKHRQSRTERTKLERMKLA